MAAPISVLKLVENFEQNIEAYQGGKYKETPVRSEFIDPFFKALGWDLDNISGYAESYRDVVREDSMKIGSSTKAPDYSFRIGGQRKFFVEAKKPSVNVKTDLEPAYQLRRYAWSAKLSLSIVTDFEEFAIYDCRQKPNKSDKASTSRLFYCTFREYADKWDEISSIFSKESVLRGSFDRYAVTSKGKRGTSEVDGAFLEEIENWRDALARNIALRNPAISQRDLNFTVQQTIDRIIFLRICEDRGIESYGRLQALVSGTGVYEKLAKVFLEADEKYNSGLFHFTQEKGRAGAADELTLQLKIDDKPLKEVFKNLYYPDSPYEFSVLGADILGSVYEQFLGKVIRLTPGNRAVVEDKPEVKKAGGVFYTPSYVVQFIVRSTIGKILEGKSVKQAEAVSIVDPACGSGSFLIGAYQYLLDWYLNCYVEDGAEKYSKGKSARLHQSAKGEWKLTTAEKRRILLQHIYGVDIDAQAVEVTKLSLLLKVLEGETEQTINSQMKLFHERVLPDLDANIQCGNSLIGPEFHDGELDLSEDTAQKVNVFDWRKGFPAIFRRGGFDAVIGNPPWGADIDKYLAYLHETYPATTQEHTDSFKLFIEKSINLLSSGGIGALIVPNTILRQSRLKDVRSVLMNTTLESLVDLGENVFKGVVAPSCIFVAKKEARAASHAVALVNVSSLTNAQKEEVLLGGAYSTSEVLQEDFKKNPDTSFVPPQKEHSAVVMALGEMKVLECKDAGINYQRVGTGMQDKGKSDLSDRLLYEGARQLSRDKMYWKGTDINKYWIAEKTERFCRPNYKDFIKPNEVVRLNSSIFETTPKILLRQTADRPIATVDHVGVWFGRSVIAIMVDPESKYRPEYFVGILNSKYIRHLYCELTQEAGRVFAQVKLAKIKQLPIAIIDFKSKEQKEKHDNLVALVEKMTALLSKKSEDGTPHGRVLLQRQIESIDRQIDKCVYSLYELTADEVSQVESQFPSE